MLIEVEHVTLGYEAVPVLEDVNFRVNAGDYLAVLGENGSGKSTLIKGLLGLLKPRAGRIRFGEGMSRRQIGYLPQQTQIQRDFPAAVGEVVLSGCLNQLGWRPFYSRAQAALADENMRRMDVLPLKNQPYRSLSGGQQQRVLLARALCATQRLLLLDEPVTGLDPAAAQEMYGVIRGLNRGGVTIIMITHDLRGALDDASHVLEVAGRTCAFMNAEAYRGGARRA
ncbi:MAG: ATP-binding cassette domain-containing protein [Clostridia bacterium]|nr:ATP-binding cassette domain-containing protein [Clostridia bacterium]